MMKITKFIRYLSPPVSIVFLLNDKLNLYSRFPEIKSMKALYIFGKAFIIAIVGLFVTRNH